MEEGCRIYRCAVIGQAPMRFPWGFDEEDSGCRKMKIELAQQVMALRQRGVTQFLTACDCGVGLYAAEIVNGLRETTDQGLMLFCYTPHEEQATKWAPYLRERYFTMLEKCTHISVVCPVGTPDAQLQAYMAVAEAQSASVYRKASMLIKQIFADALTCDLIQVDPTTKYTFKRVRREKEDTGEEYLTDAQVATLLAAIKGIYPLETFVKLGLYAGLRREESLALQWDCVDLNADTPQIEVTRTCIFCHNRPEISNVTKTAAGHRNIPIPVPLFNHLKGIKKSVASDFVICNSSGLPLSETQFRNMWRKIKRRSVGPDEYIRYKQHGKKSHSVNREAGQTAAHNPNVRYIIDFPVKTHMLRKTYITNLIYSGVDVRTVMDYAGHKNPDVTLKIYAQAKSAEKRTESAKQINEVFPSDPTT